MLKLQISSTYNRFQTSFLIAMQDCPSDLTLFSSVHNIDNVSINDENQRNEEHLNINFIK